MVLLRRKVVLTYVIFTGLLQLLLDPQPELPIFFFQSLGNTGML